MSRIIKAPGRIALFVLFVILSTAGSSGYSELALEPVSCIQTGLDAAYECELIIECDSTSSPYHLIICTVKSRIWNTGSSPGRILDAEIVLDPGLFLGPGGPLIPPGGWLLQPGDTIAPVSWIVRSISRNAPARLGIGVIFIDSAGNSVICRDSVDIRASPKLELTVNCSSSLTELEADTVHGGYVQDSLEISLSISNTGELAVYDLEASAGFNDFLQIAGDTLPIRIPRLDPGAPAVDANWLLRIAPRERDGTVCVLFLVWGEDPAGSPIPTHDCEVCIRIPKASEVTGIRRPHPVDAITLEQNRPNPFNSVTAIEYTLVTDSHVRITVYDLFGRRVVTLADERASAGVHGVTFRSNGLPAGVFFYRLDAGGMSVTRRMVVAR